MDMLDFEKLNDLISELSTLKSHMQEYGSDPKMGASLVKLTSNITAEFGQFLDAQLHDIYRNHFRENNVQPILEYLWHEVTVCGEEYFVSELMMGIKPNPLRIEVRNESGSISEILWEAGQLVNSFSIGSK
jgi:hypothetical protein